MIPQTLPEIHLHDALLALILSGQVVLKYQLSVLQNDKSIELYLCRQCWGGPASLSYHAAL